MKRVLLATVIAGAFAVSAPAVFAQAANTSTDVVAAQGATEAPAVQRQAQPERRFRLPSERIEARIAYLRTALKITSAQQAQFDNFANVLRTQARDMDKRMQERRAQFAQRGQAAPGAQAARPRENIDAIARLERSQARMQERSARLGQVITAAKPLYASFSPEQKQIADEMLAKGGRGGHGGGHHRHGMHRPAA